MVQDVPSLIALWPTRKEFADDIGAPVDRVHKWAQSGAIPSKDQAAVLRACEARGFLISPLQLIEMHARPDRAAS